MIEQARDLGGGKFRMGFTAHCRQQDREIAFADVEQRVPGTQGVADQHLGFALQLFADGMTEREFGLAQASQTHHQQRERFPVPHDPLHLREHPAIAAHRNSSVGSSP